MEPILSLPATDSGATRSTGLSAPLADPRVAAVLPAGLSS